MTNFRFTRNDKFPLVLKNIIIINVIVFVAQLLFKEQNLTAKIGLWPVQSPNFKPYQIVTHFFAHDPTFIFHIVFNMLTLWMFGRILENVWGPKKFLTFYLICGLGAAAAHLGVTYFEYKEIVDLVKGAKEVHDYQSAEVLTNLPFYAVGASGAVMGVMVAFAFLFPNTPLYIMLIPVPVKAKWAIIGFVAMDLFGGVYPIKGDNIAHFAHLGGALTGFLLVLYWNKTNRKTLY
jgi:membrane associated rhomboid family serine protease